MNAGDRLSVTAIILKVLRFPKVNDEQPNIRFTNNRTNSHVFSFVIRPDIYRELECSNVRNSVFVQISSDN